MTAGSADPAPPVDCPAGTLPLNAPAPTVIGLDLSLTATGMSDGVTAWTVTSKGHKGDSLAVRTARLRELRAAITKTIPSSTSLVVVEQPAFSRQMGHMHDRSGLWWLVVQRLVLDGLAVAEVSPTVLKKYATGKGNANKGAMVEATTRRYPEVNTRGDDNACDALWLAVLGLDHLSGTHRVPESHRVVLSSVDWPVRSAA